jgi:hypothetical protein
VHGNAQCLVSSKADEGRDDQAANDRTDQEEATDHSSRILLVKR